VSLDPVPSRVLAVLAHPDDVDFGAAGTVATLIDLGAAVTYCIATDGQAGGSDRTISRSRMAEIRRSEQVAAAAAIGVTDVRFLGYRDGELTVTHDLRRDISRVIRQVQPEVVITQSPERNWERIYASHPDHLAAGEATMQAVYPDARNPFAHMSLLDDEGLEPWAVPEVWIMVAAQMNHHIDVTDVVERKFAALAEHASQMPEDFSHVRERVTMWMSSVASHAGLHEGRLAEGFLRVDTA
jgi:LmbE family N-acetylglucosaminyl deacetylase